MFEFGPDVVMAGATDGMVSGFSTTMRGWRELLESDPVLRQVVEERVQAFHEELAVLLSDADYARR